MKKYLSILMIAVLVAFASCSKDDEKTVYTVTFETDGGTPVPSTQQVEQGSTATAPATNPAKTGYVFVNWHLNGATTAYNFQTPVNENIILFAKWQDEATAEYWQVSWQLNGGAWPSDDNHAIEVLKGGTLSEPAEPTKNNYTFEGWYKEADLINKINFPYDVSDITDDITLYAKWVEPESEYWEISWELNGGEWPAEDNHITKVEKGNTIDEPAEPTKEGNIFEGWYKETTFTNSVEFPYTPTSDITLYAKWKEEPMAVYYGTWRDSRFEEWDQFTIEADKIVMEYRYGEYFTYENLTWTEINSQHEFAEDYPIGFKVSGTLTKANGINIIKEDRSDYANIGDRIALNIYIATDKKSIVMGLISNLNNEEMWGPYDISHVGFYQVMWNLNGGAWPTEDNHLDRVAKDGMLIAPASPTKTDNNFGGWYEEPSLITRVSFPYDASSRGRDFSLYAKWNDATPSAKLSVTKNPHTGYYASISVQNQAGSYVYSIPTGAGTSVINVVPGTYRIYYSYWACLTVNCYSSGWSSWFTVSTGQTKNISLVGSAVGIQ